MVSIPPYKIIRTQRKTVALIVENDGSLIVRAPLHASDRQIQAIVAEKADWIHARQAAARQMAAPPPKQFAAGEEFRYLGSLYPLEITGNTSPSLALGERFSLSQAALPKARETFERWYRQQARQVFTGLAERHAKRLGLAYTSLRLSSARTRWGSCSSRGTLSFTWRLVMAPLEVVEYVVIHELIHLQEKNHSAKFWSKVQAALPDYQPRRDWLKKNGRLLDW